MTHEELKTKVKELEALLKTGNDYALVETQARELLTDDALANESELHARALFALSQSLWQRGLAQDALPFSEQALTLAEQIESKELQAKALGNIGTVHSDLSDYALALEYLCKALSLAEALDNKAGMATYLSNIGIVHLEHSDYALALEYYGKALALDEELGNKAGVAACLGNIGNVYANLSDYARALEYYGKALLLNEELGNEAGVAIQFGNIGVVHGQLSDYVRALEYFGKALALHEELGNKALVASWLGNIGTVHYSLSNYASALEYYGKALALAEEVGNKALVADNLGNIGETYTKHDFDGYDPAKAEEFLLRAIAMNEELGTKGQNLNVFKGLSELYATSERWKESREQFEKYHNLEKEVQSEEAHKQANLMEQRRQAAEREKEIELAKAAAAAKLTATTALLHRVLPESIATRMIAGEQDISDYFTSVTILFADIAGFTPISAGMPAYMVVRFLNFVFGRFDAIMKRHGCEKIKTIGDGYMAVAGAPVECADHAERMAFAALEMQQDIRLPEEFKEYMPEGVDFGIRIGLHTGSVVGGVIGDERFVYDIYSDAVNTAARMESHGEPDKIHVSHDFYIHLQNRFAMTKNTTHGITFEKRGEMDIKGKGIMKTYFLERAE